MSDPEALCLIEFSSIASGTRAIDALIKKAPVKVERVGTLQPGKMAVLFSGGVASVTESHGAACAAAKDTVSDHVLLPRVNRRVYRATMGYTGHWHGDTLGVIETMTMAAVVEAADVAVKGANVRVVSIRLGDELGGKGLCHIAGDQHDVEAAIELAVERADRPGRDICTSITPRMDDELRDLLARTTRYWGGPE